ncbi:hypothetical protein N2152v2_002692 [Parachlorella kessleri]
MYPRDQAFLQEVSTEVEYQAARLSTHPSIALWGGNNENEAAFTWFGETLARPQLYAVDYSTLFVDTIRRALLSVDPSIIYLDTSPSNGIYSTEPYVKRWGDVADPHFGDVHFYDYSSDALDPLTYPPAKFVSEFGYMSFPLFSVYQKVTEPQDWAINATMTNFRLRHANGVQQLLAQMRLHFLSDTPPVTTFSGSPDSNQPSNESGTPSQGTPAGALRPSEEEVAGTATEGGVGPSPVDSSHNGAAEEFRAFVYLSQVQQSLVYETAISRWRRLKKDPSAVTYGVLYWQLNDIWQQQQHSRFQVGSDVQGPSWSSINYGGAWKLLHHTARAFFQPVAVSGVVDRQEQTVTVHLVNDLSVGVTGNLTIDAIPYTATNPEDIIHLTDSPGISVASFDAGPIWNASIPGWLLPTVLNASGGGALGPQDFFLRLRYCPTGTAATPGYHSPFTAAAAPGPSIGNSSSNPASFLRASSPVSEEEAGDGSALPASAVSSDCPMLGAGADAEACDAAQRMLQCSQSFVYLSEFRDASLAQGQVEVTGVEWVDRLGGSSLTDPSQAALLGSLGNVMEDRIAVHLSAPFLALFVSLESPLQGQFLLNGMHLLPWENATVHFALHEPSLCTVQKGCSSDQRARILEEFREGLTVQWLQQEVGVMERQGAAMDGAHGSGGAAGVQQAGQENGGSGQAQGTGGGAEGSPKAGQLPLASSVPVWIIVIIALLTAFVSWT